MPSVEEGRPSEEVEQPQKKRPGEGEVGESDEEEPKRQKVEDDRDDDFMSQSVITQTIEGEVGEHLFSGRDFDDDDGSDDESRKDLICIARLMNMDFDLDEWSFGEANEDGRNCHKVPRCNLFLHKSEYFGLPVFELFKVKLILNEERNRSLSGKLYGAIELLTSPENPDRISYFSVKNEDAFPIHLNPGNNKIYLPLSFPKAKALTVFERRLEVKFTFTFENGDNGEAIDVFEELGSISEDDEVCDDDGSGGHKAKSDSLFFSPSYVHGLRHFSCRLRNDFLAYPNSDIIRVAPYYAIFGGAWATVDVKFLDKGVSKYYGSIFARPCIFVSRIRLLSRKKDQMHELPKSGDIVLARPVVAVPVFCSLVIAVWLFDQDGKEIVREKAFFKVLRPEEGEDKCIAKGRVHIEVKWKCEIPDSQMKFTYY